MIAREFYWHGAWVDDDLQWAGQGRTITSMLSWIRRHWLLTTGITLLALLLVAAYVAALYADDLIASRLRPATIRLLSERFGSDVDIREMKVRVMPSVTVQVAGVSLRHRGRTDVPPLISIKSMTMDTSVWRLWNSNIVRIHLDGLAIVIPPERSAAIKPLISAPPSDEPKDDTHQADAFIGEIISENATLTILPRRENKAPREFVLHRIRLENLQFSKPMPFEATLTNPIPAGMIETVGTLGPWSGDEPGDTPLNGTFTFNADLGTIKGISGALTSEGSFGGILERIETSGQTSTPDFRVTTLKGNPLPLHTTFKAIVDGTNGDVTLERVDAKLADSTFITSGAIIGRKDVKGRFIRLDIHGQPAQLADIFRLAMKGPRPAMTGGLTINARMDLPPGERDVVERMTLDGQFHIARARFTNDAVQDKIDELARRGSGRPADDGLEKVMSDMRGDFTLGNGVLRLPNLTFSTVGAAVALAGQYNLEKETLDFRGDIRLQASASQMVTGFKSMLLKPFDPLLRKRGAGTRLAIKVTGTRDKPAFGVELGRTFKGQ